MGVKFLDSYMRKNVLNGLKLINIRDEIESYRKNHNSDPIIVINLKPFLRWSFQSDKSAFLCGGRTQLFEQTLRKFFATLKSLGARLVSFIDGPPQHLERWCKRHDINTSNELLFLAKVAWVSVSELTRIAPVDYLSSFDRTLVQIAREHGELFFSVKLDSDACIARFASQKNALAVLTNGSDFLIFEGDWKYWSVSDIDLETMQTIEYSREALRIDIGAREWQMPFFASLAGNDLVERDEVFLENIKTSHSRDFKDIIQYLTLQGESKDVCDHETLLNRISIDVKGFKDEKFIENLKWSISFYDTTGNYETVKDELQKNLLEMDDCYLYCLYEGIPTDYYLRYFDVTSPEYLSYAMIFAFILARMMGVLLKDKYPDGEYDPQHFLAQPWHSEPFQLLTVTPIEPEIYLPPLNELIFANHEDKQLEIKRFRLLAWMISPRISGEKLQAIKGEFLATAATLLILVDSGFVAESEADIALLALNDLIKGTIPEKLSAPVDLHRGHFMISFLIPAVQKIVNRALDVCGLGKYAKVAHDGVHFHKLLQEWEDKSKEEQEELVAEISKYRLYVS